MTAEILQLITVETLDAQTQARGEEKMADVKLTEGDFNERITVPVELVKGARVGEMLRVIFERN